MIEQLYEDAKKMENEPVMTDETMQVDLHSITFYAMRKKYKNKDSLSRGQ
jgi:hypothetical protein